MRDKPVILVFRQSMTQCPTVPDARLRLCQRCGEACWVVPATLEVIKEHGGGKLICSVCFPDAVDNPQRLVPTQRQIEAMTPEVQGLVIDMVRRIRRNQVH